MSNITTNTLINHLILFGLIDLAKEVENATYVSIKDFSHFTVTDEAGYGDEFVVESDENTVVVYGRLVEPEGGTVWMFRDHPDYEAEIPELAKKFIGYSANWQPMFVHPESHSHRPDLNMEAISKINLPEDNTFFRGTVDLGRIIGKDHLVETNPEDVIVYLQRGNRPGKSRMVLKEAADTQFVTIIACVAREEEGTPDELVGQWILVTLFEGKPGEREPFDRSFADGKNPEGLKAAKEFWSTHALVPTDEEMEMIRNGDADGDINFDHEIILQILDALHEHWNASVAAEDKPDDEKNKIHCKINAELMRAVYRIICENGYNEF